MATSALNPNIVRTRLDRIVQAEFTPAMKPGYASVENKKIFNQIPSYLGSQQEETFAGSGYWEQRSEQQNVPRNNSRFGNNITFTNVEFSRAEDIPKHFFDDSKFNAIVRIVRETARNGRQTQQSEGFKLFRNAFSSTGTLTGNGLSLINNSQTLLNSAQTVDNYLTDKLVDGVVNDLIVILAEMRKHDGVIAEYVPEVLLVPSKGFKRATEIVESEWSAQTANNAMNVYSAKYGIFVYQSSFIGTAAGGSDDYAFMLGNYHEVNRYVREALNTWSRPWEMSDNRTYTYGQAYREIYGVPDFQGVAATDGTTGAYV